MIYTLFQFYSLKFTEEDYTPCVFYLKRGYYNELGIKFLELYYETASARQNDTSTIGTLNIFFSWCLIMRILEEYKGGIWIRCGTLHIVATCR